MPLPVIAGCLRITVSGNVTGGGRWANTWHASNGATEEWDNAEIEGFHDIFSQFYLGPNIGAGFGYMGWCYEETTVDNFSYTPLDGLSGAVVFTDTAPGTDAALSMPAEVAQVLTIRTAARGRQNRGRVYLPAAATSKYNADGHIGAAMIAGVLAQIQGVQAALVVAGATLGVGSYGPYVGAGTPHFTPVTTFTMDDSADVQRGRKT